MELFVINILYGLFVFYIGMIIGRHRSQEHYEKTQSNLFKRIDGLVKHIENLEGK